MLRWEQEQIKKGTSVPQVGIYSLLYLFMLGLGFCFRFHFCLGFCLGFRLGFCWVRFGLGLGWVGLSASHQRQNIK